MMQRIPRAAVVSPYSLVLAALVIYTLLSTLALQTSLLSSPKPPERANTPVTERRGGDGNGNGNGFHSLVSLLESEVSCPLSNVTVAHPFGTFDEVPRGACAFKVAPIEFPKTIAQDFEGFRLPYYASDATRHYRCRAFEEGGKHIMGRDLLDSEAELLHNAGRICTMERNDTELIAFLSEKSSLKEAQVLSALRIWMNSTTAGKTALEAIQRVFVLEDTQIRREYHLISEQSEWKRMLASDVGQQVFPDVNSHVVELPQTTLRAMLIQNGKIEKNGRISTLNGEVFYPKRAPYSHISLMESIRGTLNSHKFTPNQSQRTSFALKILRDRPHAEECFQGIRNELRAFPCPKGKESESEDMGVARVLVTSQTLGSQMFHYMCENLPRLGVFLDYAKNDPSLHIHVGCSKKAGYCLPLLELLGINRSRVVMGPIYGKKIIVPEGGRRHWPLGNFWGLMALREAIVPRYFPEARDHRTYCEPLLQDESGVVDSPYVRRLILRVAIIRRSLTRLSAINAKWYDNIQQDLMNDLGYELNFNVQLDVTLFDDRDKAIMGDALSQIKQFRSADVIIGAHGAAWSWITYAQPCTHVISFRGRTNSDIFEHLSLGMGVRFHHILFRNSYDLLMRDIKRNLGIAVAERIQTASSRKPPLIVAVCPTCGSEAAQRLASIFDLVLIGKKPTGMTPHQVVYVEALQDPCFHKYRAIVRKHLEDQGFSGSESYWGWIGDPDLVINPRFASFWVPLNRFDAVLFAESPSGNPLMALFSIAVVIPPGPCLSLNGMGASFLGILLDQYTVSIVVSALLATAVTTDGRTFHIPSSLETEQAKFKRLALTIDSRSPYEIFYSHRFPCSEDVENHFVMLRNRNLQDTWGYRCPPIGSVIQKKPSVDNLGSPGSVKFVETAFARASKLSCTLPVQSLSDDNDAELHCS